MRAVARKPVPLEVVLDRGWDEIARWRCVDALREFYVVEAWKP